MGLENCHIFCLEMNFKCLRQHCLLGDAESDSSTVLDFPPLPAADWTGTNDHSHMSAAVLSSIHTSNKNPLHNSIFTEQQTHLSQFRAAEVPITVQVQVLEELFNEESFLGCSVPGQAAGRALPPRLQVQQDALQPAVVCHAAAVT